MGFQRGKLNLEFGEDSEFAELKVRSNRLSVGELLDVSEWGELINTWRGTSDELRQELKVLFSLLDEKIVSWNYEDEARDDEGNVTVVPVPKTAESLARIDIAMLTAIMSGIVQGSRLPVPKEKPSKPGLIEASLPMELLEENPPM